MTATAGGHSRRADVALRPWAASDLRLLQSLLGDPEMTRNLGGPESQEAIRARHERFLVADPAEPRAVRRHRRPGGRGLGFELLGEVEVDYPTGVVMRSNDWRLDLAMAEALVRHTCGDTRSTG